jgi:peptidoglycan/xylan/chitin deacetylase (PgdA/CDA1 family)/2-polyprenyl-3-methyl-5-hydroxy-6-metoxy-1,4-benzoquinol methylase
VHSFYKASFGRLADPAGLANCLQRLASGVAPEALAEGLTASAEFQTRHGSTQRVDAEFLNALYRDGLGRKPDPGGLANWLAEAEKGATPAKVVAAFAGSDEAIRAAANLLVSSLYQTAFGRHADEDGLTRCVKQLQSGFSLEALAEGLTASAEFRIRHGPSQKVDTEYLTALYRDGLRREPDPESLASWLAEGKKGATRAKVLAGFAGSSEALQRVVASACLSRIDDPAPLVNSVNSVYNGGFRRLADEADLGHRVRQLHPGVTLEVLAEQIEASAEFQPRHGSLSEGKKGASGAKVIDAFAVNRGEMDHRNPVCSDTIYDRVGAPEYWDRFFATPDPWGYMTEYEVVKRGHTLSAVPLGGSERALELACAEGHFTTLLSQRVGTLVASDISGVALERAARRCHGNANITFQKLDIVRDPIPGQFDLIVCSEILYYLGTVERLHAVMQKLIDALVPGGLLVMEHANLVSDDPDRTGFDWPGHSFGAKTIGDVASHLDGLTLERELRTPLYRVQRFRRVCSGTGEDALRVVDLPLSIPLDRKLERGIVWDGAIRTREAALRGENATTLPILCYHRIAENGPPALALYRIHPRAFEQQIRWLRRHGYYSVSAAQWAEAMQQNAPLPGRPVLFTFDDGYQDFADVAWPVLDRHGFSALVFIVAEKVGGSADWDGNFGEPAPLMGWGELRQLSRDGVDFGSHTLNHRRLDSLAIEEVVKECTSSRAILEEKLERAISAISYPYGANDEDVRRTVAESGYTVAVTTRNKRAQLTDDRLTLPRIEIFGDCSLRRFVDLIETGVTQ